MRKTIIAGLLATMLIPTVSQAQISPQDRRELRRDRQDVRQERRDLQDARQNGSQRDIREQRRDVRDARQELREDRRDIRGNGYNNYGYGNNNYGRNDWRGYRELNRNLYRGNQYNYGFRYQQFRPGLRIAPQYFGQRYIIGNPYDYRLPRAGFNQRWVRHYNDVVLVDYRRGIVIDVIRGIFY